MVEGLRRQRLAIQFRPVIRQHGGLHEGTVFVAQEGVEQADDDFVTSVPVFVLMAGKTSASRRTSDLTESLTFAAAWKV